MDCKLIWNSSSIAKRKQMFNDVQNYVDNECVKKMSEYVPVALPKYENAGMLRDSVEISEPGTIIYTAPFAKKRYYDPDARKPTGNPKASRLWFEVMKSKHKDEIKKGVREITKRGI